MRKGNNKAGFTLVELIVAFAIIVIVFAAVVPQFRAIRNSWTGAEAIATIIQNGRVLAEHITRNLAAAKQIISVSPDSQTDGFITFKDNNDVTKCYMFAGGYVVFGAPGSEQQLAGPVDRFQISCYSLSDFSNPTTDANDIRLVQIEADFPNSDTLGTDKTFTASVHLQSNVDAACGILACWKLDETSGLTAADSTGSGNDGNLFNMAGNEWTDGAVGGALHFDGSNDYMAIQNLHYDSSGYPEVTVTAWIRTSNGGNQIIASYDRNEYWRLEINGSGGGTGQVGWDVRTNAGQVDYGSITRVDDGEWHHVAGVFDNGTMTIYIDGSPEPSTSRGSTFGRGVNTRYGFLGVGSEATTFNGSRGPNNYFDGDMDDVRIYDRALSAGEIAQLVNLLRYQAPHSDEKVGSDDMSINIPTPAADEGDLLIAAVATDEDTSTSIAAPLGQGWTLIDRSAYNGQVTLGAWWKLAGASEPASHTFDWMGVGQQAYGWMMRFTGHDSTNPINDYASYGELSGTPTSPAVTTTVDNCLILRLGAFDDDDITISDPGLHSPIDHTAITMDESSSSVGQVIYGGFDEGKRTNNWTYVTVTAPAGISSGDLLIAAVATDGGTSTTIAAPAGWTLLDRGSDSLNRVTLGVWWKLAGASEPSSYTFTWTGYERAYGWVMRFTGHDPADPINDHQFQQGTSSDSTPPCPSVTTTVADTMIVRIGGFDRHNVTIDNPGLAGHTGITMDESNANNQACSGGAGYSQQAAIGASGTVNFTLTASRRYRTVTIAIAPVAGGGTVSGGAGYIKQSGSGDSGTSSFSLGSSNEAQMLTIAIAPADSGDDCCRNQISP